MIAPQVSRRLVKKENNNHVRFKQKELVDKLKKLSRKEHNIYIVDKMAESVFFFE